MGADDRRARVEVAVIATGIFSTGLAWPGLIGRLPLGLLLKNQLQLPAQQVASFWAIATFAYYVKPAVALICDAYPLFGTRRRGYLVAGAGAAGACWLALAAAPRSYAAMLALITALNVALIFATATVGGMQVEVGQRHGATGRLSALRQGLVGVMSLVAGPLGGWLATRPLGWTAAIGALVLLSFAVTVALLYPEPRGARPDAAVWTAAGRQLRAIVQSRAMWATAGLMFLVNASPGFQTPLLYYQQDVLRFTPQLMGTLQLVGGAGALAGAALYAVLCRFVPLRVSLLAGIVLNAASTLLFLRYDSPAAAALIHGGGAVVGTVAALPLYDLAARATPKGSESLGFALIMSVYTLATYAVSDPLGSYLYGQLHLGFKVLVCVNAAWTLAALLFLPSLPRALTMSREGRSQP